MQNLDLTADELVRGLLELSRTEHVSLLDSCGVRHLGSHLLIAGVGGTRTRSSALEGLIDERRPTIFTLSYELGAALNEVAVRRSDEPEIFATAFGTLIVHDYTTGATTHVGEMADVNAYTKRMKSAAASFELQTPGRVSAARSNFTRDEYIAAIEAIQGRIRCGDTYQTNLTQKITAETVEKPQDVFWRLRRDHPAPFAAFITRADSVVVSASPERFFRVRGHIADGGVRVPIETSPIKGTRRRGRTASEDQALRRDLLNSAKDRAENTMIVDLLRNDLGRVCEYGSVSVEKLCELEEHPTLFHLVSTVSGELRRDVRLADVLRALFPCGSITGAPKISTMRIIDAIEQTPRGLSMGAIGYSIPPGSGNIDPVIDLNVAIRTMVFRDGVATFNVGGGITIDSDPEAEYEESLLKAQALLTALNARLDSRH